MARWTVFEPRAFLALAVALIGAAPAPGDEKGLAFARHGQPVATRDLAALKKLAPEESVRVFEPYEAREVAFRALRFDRALDAIYGAGWRREEELLFTCRDGYQPTVPVARAIAHVSWLAFAREGAPAFSIQKRESGRVQEIPLGPFYLIWDTKDPQVRTEGDYGWPYQVVGVELIRSRDRFPHMAPPANAPPQAQRGFAAFRIHCSRCHAVNGDGGKIGPELNRAQGPAGRRDAAWLRDWIDDPSRISPGTRMERLNPDLPDRDTVIASIIAYLQAIADRPLREGGDGR
ncbi:MAG TPA: c-type cytochrome [Myxococcota bacterium]|nr:c-type cytochrome [Myxococcota bacterium]